jgi:Rod binding domain-containing protein
MDALSAMKPLHRILSDAEARKQADGTAEQFEALLVRQFVSSLRQTATVGEDGGLFGSGLGSDTYTDWFDQNLAEELGKSGGIGIKQVILDDLARAHQLPADPDAPTPAEQARSATALADRAGLLALTRRQAAAAPGAANGGMIDVTR